MHTTTVTKSEFRAMLKQARREQEAQEAGFMCFADAEAAHRAKVAVERRARLQGRVEALRASQATL